MSMTNMLKQAETAIRAVTKWLRMPLLKGVPRGTQGFTGKANGWTFIVMAFPIEDQGFSPGSRGYDGTGTFSAVGSNVIIRLPRPLAELACNLAEQAGLNGLPVQHGDVEDRAAYRLAQLAQQGVKGELIRKGGNLRIRLPDGVVEDV